MRRETERPYVSTSFWLVTAVGTSRIPRPRFAIQRRLPAPFAASSDAKKSVVSSPSPLWLLATGRRVASRSPSAGPLAVSFRTRTSVETTGSRMSLDDSPS